MSTSQLGETIDLHMGSSPLLFPHHENEIAICEAATGKPFVKYWLHSEQVLMDGRRMSREQGNYLTVADLEEKGFSGREIRFFLLSTHYRKPLQFSYQGLYSTRRTLQRLDHFFMRLQMSAGEGEGTPEVLEWMAEARSALETAMDDDLNVSRALASIFGLVRKVNAVLDNGGLNRQQVESLIEFFNEFNSIFNILNPETAVISDEGVMELIRERDEARKRKDWREADRLREELAGLGIQLVDTPGGTLWFKREPEEIL
jgi:cysteinyl-tRNA synthetase